MQIQRREALGILCVGLTILAGCDSESEPDTTATVFNKEGVHQAMKAVIDAVEALEGDVEDFRTTSWKEVVPNVESGVGELRDAVDKLRQELGYSD